MYNVVSLFCGCGGVDLGTVGGFIFNKKEYEKPSVIIARRPCALLKVVKVKPPVTVNSEKCRKCGMC